MPTTVIVLTEEALLPVDVTHIRGVAGPDATDVRIIVPSGVRRSVVADVIDHLAVLDLKEAWEDITGANDLTPHEAVASATAAMVASEEAFAQAGVTVTRAVVADDVVEALRTELTTTPDDVQVFAVTQPRAVSDAFHRGWIDRIEDELHVAVLHFYTGTSYLEA